MNKPLEDDVEKCKFVKYVAEMYATGKYTTRELAKKLGVSKSTIGNCINNFLIRVVGLESDLYMRVVTVTIQHNKVHKRKVSKIWK